MDTSSDEEYAMGPYRAKLRSLSRQSSHRTLSEAESTIMDAIQTRKSLYSTRICLKYPIQSLLINWNTNQYKKNVQVRALCSS
jgi:hypothetical protein